MVVILVPNDPRITNAYSFPAWQGGRGRGEMGKLSLRQSAGGKTKPKITTVKREECLTAPHSHPDLSGCTGQSKEALVAVTEVPKAPKGGRRTSVEQEVPGGNRSADTPGGDAPDSASGTVTKAKCGKEEKHMASGLCLSNHHSEQNSKTRCGTLSGSEKLNLTPS